MCGIAGFMGSGSESDLYNMIRTIKYRGPDDEGIFFMPSVGLAHARLSIIDLSSAGHQPMSGGSGRLYITFNGEIYNFHELKELVSDYPFQSKTDTEVILALYEKFGVECFEKLDGMFALAIYDREKDELVLARDRIGKKPLYWSRSGETIIFGSELRALTAHPLFKKEIDPAALSKYLFYEYVPTPHTIFKNVFKLNPASYLIFKNSTVEMKKFWWPDYSTTADNFSEAIETLDSALSNAVRKRLVSDVPLGVLLSGGIDSSAVAYYAQQANPRKIETFSIGFDDPSFDESAFARSAARFLGTEHHELLVTAKEALELMTLFPEIADEPLADPSLIPTYILSKFARQNVIVSLGGDGGDELFSGYPMFQADIAARLYEKVPLLARQRLIEPLIQALPVGYTNLSMDFKLKRFISGFGVPSSYRHHQWLASFPFHEQRQLLAKGVYEQLNGASVYEDLDRHIQESRTDVLSRQINHLYLRTYLMDDILTKVDRASMHNGLEVRAPFLDSKVVELVNTFPKEFKQRGMRTKYILKKMMNGKLPRSIIDRPKKGFGLPLAKWLVGDLKNLCNEVLSHENIASSGLFDWEHVRRLKDAHFNKKANNYKQIWTLMVFQMWHKRWFN